MIYKNIVTKKTWTDNQGNNKVKWLVVGTYKETDDGKQFIELNMFPGVPFYVFEQKAKEDRAAGKEANQEPGMDF